MKSISVFLAIVGFASAQSLFSDQWKELKSPLESPRYQEIISKIFPENTSTNRANRGGRIAGGELAVLGQFVHQALLLTTDVNGDTFVCGGSVLSHNWILTAAHCLDSVVKVSVYVGIIDRINGPAIWGIDITNPNYLKIHENYNRTNVVNDIALIRLANTIVNDLKVGIVQLPSRSEAGTVLDGKLATIAGFGRYSDTSGPSPNLRWVRTLVAPNDKCEKVFGKANVRDTNLCLDTTGGKSTCQGDSGGGLTVELNGKTIIVGVVSYGAATSCTQNHPAVFTRVTSFLDWIESNTGIRIN